MLAGPDWRGADGEVLADVVEDGATFIDNAMRKAVAAVRQTGLSALADDSGLLVDALDGAPGVHSARYAGTHGDDSGNIDKLLRELAEVAEHERSASFACALVLAGPIAEGPGANRTEDGIAWRATEGQVFGQILAAREGAGGFGYDPVFWCNELGASFGVASAKAKASVSHRARAFAALAPMLMALRHQAAEPIAPLFLRAVGVAAVADALATTFGQDLRYAVSALERSLGQRPELGARERATVNALMHSTIRRLGLLQLAADALHDEPLRSPDPRRLRPNDATWIGALAMADVDPEGVPLPHRAPGERSALRALLERSADFAQRLPATIQQLEKALRIATRRLAELDPDVAAAIEAGVHPDFRAALIDAYGADDAGRMLAALAQQGPPTIRLADPTMLATMRRKVEALGTRTVEIPGLDGAFSLLESARVTALPEFAAGRFEMQDAGSQRIVTLVDAQPGMLVADWCAGAGGKTLGLAAAMEGRGRLVALDVHDKRLDEARRRLHRAGHASWVRVERLAPRADGDVALGAFDRVLVDAPCSSTGALRRTPELRWHIDSDWLGRFAPEQLGIALRAARRVRPGGRLIYATCSLMTAENEAIAARLAETLQWPVLHQERFGLADLPTLRRGPVPRVTADGFFCAILERPHDQA